MINVKTLVLLNEKDQGIPLFEFLQRLGAFPNELKCPNCQNLMHVSLVIIIFLFLIIFIMKFFRFVVMEPGTDGHAKI
jgi:hypothetical protein